MNLELRAAKDLNITSLDFLIELKALGGEKKIKMTILEFLIER